MVEWAVKAIYTGYLGWFDGTVSKLMPTSDEEYRETMLSLIGEDLLRAKIKECIF